MSLDRRGFLGGAAVASALVPAIARADGGTPIDLAADARFAAALDPGFSGAVLVTRGGRVLHRAGRGPANREHGVPNTADTRFKIASITKTLTAGAVLTLAQTGRLDLDAPVTDVLPGAPETWSPIRVWQLLNHGSGLPDVVRQPGFATRAVQPATLQGTVERLATLPLDFAPGSDTRYGNSGPIVAARLIEVIAGQSYADYLRAAVYGPLGMADSGYADHLAVIPGLADGYRPDANGDGAFVRPGLIDMSVTVGAGSEYSTLDDMARWISGAEAGRLAGLELTRRMFTPTPSDYGLGWMVSTFDGRRMVSHIGDINGFGSFLLRLPEPDVSVVVLSNLERTPVRALALALARMALDNAVT